MSINLGSNPFGLYLGSSKIGEAYVGNVKVYSSRIELPAKTLRFQFSNSTNPSSSSLSLSGTWTRVSSSPNIWDWNYNSSDWNGISSSTGMFSTRKSKMNNGTCSVIAGNLYGVTDVRRLFGDISSSTTNDGLTEVKGLYNTSSLTTTVQMFSHCTSLTSVQLFDTSNVTDMATMFYECKALYSVPLFNTKKVTRLQSFINNCTRLKVIPLFNTDAVTNVFRMCSGCTNVESGALALYQQLYPKSSSWAESSYMDCFYHCGSNTTTGAAELAQIPSSWGGTGA